MGKTTGKGGARDAGSILRVGKTQHQASGVKKPREPAPPVLKDLKGK